MQAEVEKMFLLAALVGSVLFPKNQGKENCLGELECFWGEGMTAFVLGLYKNPPQ